jgi:hypothetical protein
MGKLLKTKDIDIIIDYDVLAKLKEKGEVVKNERLSRYEINTGHFDIDIYVPNYSKLGVDAAEVVNFTVNKDGFMVPALEVLFLMKLFAWHNRRGSVKGQKDELDLFSLALLPEFDWGKYLKFTDKFNFSRYDKEFRQLLKNTRNIKELNVNDQKMSKIKKQILLKLSGHET